MVGMGYDKRIGSEFLRPGPGWGGSCFPKDSRALVKIAHDAGYRFELLEGVIAVNEQQFDRVTDKIRVAAGGSLAGATVAVWGLTFKARTDDLRDSPAISIVTRLLDEGATVRAYDPTVAGPKPGVPEGVHIAADALAGHRWSRRGRGADRVGRLPLDLTAGRGRPHGRASRRRRPQPPRPQRLEARWVQLHGNRTMTHHLVAGGGGFIGSHLADLLLARGDTVTIVDNFVTGRRSNIAHLAGHPDVTVVEHDITAPFPTAITDGTYDTVLDLASPASPDDFLVMPLEILAVGSTGTRNLLDLAVAPLGQVLPRLHQ